MSQKEFKYSKIVKETFVSLMYKSSAVVSAEFERLLYILNSMFLN